MVMLDINNLQIAQIFIDWATKAPYLAALSTDNRVTCMQGPPRHLGGEVLNECRFLNLE